MTKEIFMVNFFKHKHFLWFVFCLQLFFFVFTWFAHIDADTDAFLTWDAAYMQTRPGMQIMP